MSQVTYMCSPDYFNSPTPGFYYEPYANYYHQSPYPYAMNSQPQRRSKTGRSASPRQEKSIKAIEGQSRKAIEAASPKSIDSDDSDYEVIPYYPERTQHNGYGSHHGWVQQYPPHPAYFTPPPSPPQQPSPSPPPQKITGNRYGPTIVSGNARVYQGNICDKESSLSSMPVHSYAGCAVSDNGQVLQGNVSLEALRAYMRRPATETTQASEPQQPASEQQRLLLPWHQES